jgi:hypothetical protein
MEILISALPLDLQLGLQLGKRTKIFERTLFDSVTKLIQVQSAVFNSHYKQVDCVLVFTIFHKSTIGDCIENDQFHRNYYLMQKNERHPME